MEVHREACSEAGMSGHIAKPIDARVLITAVLGASHKEDQVEDGNERLAAAG